MLDKETEQKNLIRKLEREYQNNPKSFLDKLNSNSFDDHLPLNLLEFWRVRLEFAALKVNPSKSNNYIYLFFTCFAVGILEKLPYIVDFFDKDIYYSKFVSFPVLFGFLLHSFYLFKPPKEAVFKIIGFFLFTFLFTLFLPDWHNKPSYNGIKLSDTILLTTIHVPIFMLSILSLGYPKKLNGQTTSVRINYIHFITEVMVFIAIILLSGALLTAITLSLFNAIKINIEKFYFNWIVVWGIVSSPIVSAHLVYNQTLDKFNISQLIAKLFSPIVLITLLGYLYFTLLHLDDLFSDRHTLLTFNFMLAALFAIILFQFSYLDKSPLFMHFILIGLLVLGITINSIGLYAICKRLSEFGMTPNRLSVIGTNLCFFTSLLVMTYYLIQTLRKKYDLVISLQKFSRSLVIFPIWTSIVAFVFPIIFQFK